MKQNRIRNKLEMTYKITKSNKPLDMLIPNVSGDIFKKKSYVLNSNNVEISVWPEFIDSQVSLAGNLFVWIYHVKIANKSNEDLRLVNRYWRIIDEKGHVQEVSGEGVVGEKPLISPNANFEYSSGVHLRYPSGIMTGHYQMQKNNGDVFNVKIPTFSLDIPSPKERVN